MTTKMIKLGQLEELASAQAADTKTLQKLAGRLATRLAELAQPQWSDEGRSQERAKALGEAQKAAEGIEARMRARATEAQVGLTRWDPAARRLTAALTQPAEAAALRDRLARVPVNQLRGLAEDAKARKDWLIADAIAGRVAEFGDNESFVAIAKDIMAPLDAMDGPERAEVEATAAAIGRSFVQARVHLAAVNGKRMTGQQLVEVSMEHGSDTPTPAGVL